MPSADNQTHKQLSINNYLPTYLPTYLPACLPACLPAYLCVYLSIKLFIETQMIGCVEMCAFPYYSPGDFWCKMVAFYCQVFFR